MTATLCAIMKNEAPFIVEWAVYHRMIGFDRIIVFENDSDDDTATILKALQDRGVIDGCIPWRNVEGSPQFVAYALTARLCRTDWLMFLDADEFLNLRDGQDVNAFLGRFGPDISCVSINWRLFGSGGRKTGAPGWVLERFVHASPQSCAMNRHVKSFFRPASVDKVHMHAPVLRKGVAVGASGAPLEMEPFGLSLTVDWSVAQVNHYFTKSYEEFLAKRRRGDARLAPDDPEKFNRYDDEMFASHDLNDEIDTTIAWAIPELARRCAALIPEALDREALNLKSAGTAAPPPSSPPE